MRKILVAMIAIEVGLMLFSSCNKADRPSLADSPAVTYRDIEQGILNGRLADIHSVIVLRNGEKKAEWYFSGEDERRGRPLGIIEFGHDTLHDLRSVTKSVVSLLFGIALSDGSIASVNETMVDYFPDQAELFSTELSQIRLRDLLSMTSGIRWDERTYPYTDSRNSETAMDLARDRIRHILSEPIEAPPGERFNYSGGDVALIAKIISRATGSALEEYAKHNLFDPLGITDFEWIKDREGSPIAASGLRLRPRDMSKIGQLILQNGRWEGREIVPADWIEVSTSLQARIEPDLRSGKQYGYFWWLGVVCNGDVRIPYVEANGNGGQIIRVIRKFDAVIVTTGGFYNRREDSFNDLMQAIISTLSLNGDGSGYNIGNRVKKEQDIE